MHIEILNPSHQHAVEALNDRCFGPARHLRTASLLREGAPALDRACLVAIGDGGTLIGSVQCHMLEWRRCDGASRDMVLLGPLVSHPDHRGKGIGGSLMDACTAAIDSLGLPTMLIGDAPFYGRWDFRADMTGQWVLPGPVERARLLLRAAPDGFWDSVGTPAARVDAEQRAA